MSSHTDLWQIFRDNDGTIVPGTDLELPLPDFAPNDVLRRYGALQKSVVISSATLCQFLTTSEMKARRVEQNECFRDALEPGTRKRPRDETPPEQLNPEDERGFDQQEQRVPERTELDDSSCKTSSVLESDSH